MSGKTYLQYTQGKMAFKDLSICLHFFPRICTTEWTSAFSRKEWKVMKVLYKLALFLLWLSWKYTKGGKQLLTFSHFLERYACITFQSCVDISQVPLLNQRAFKLQITMSRYQFAWTFPLATHQVCPAIPSMLRS